MLLRIVARVITVTITKQNDICFQRAVPTRFRPFYFLNGTRPSYLDFAHAARSIKLPSVTILSPTVSPSSTT